MVLLHTRMIAILLLFGMTALSVTSLGCIGPDPNLQAQSPDDEPENSGIADEPSPVAPKDPGTQPQAPESAGTPTKERAPAPPIPVQIVAPQRPPLGPQPEFKDWNDNFTVLWKTTLGDGGAVLPMVDRSRRQVPRSEMFSRVVGVYFPEGSDEIVFLGLDDPARAHAALDPTVLLDGLAIAYRNWWQSEQQAVSIDPSPDQEEALARNPEDDPAPHQVRFIGGIRDTAVGRTAFEADRLMKCLSLGEDNTKKGTPFACNVVGYQNKFALLRQFPGESGSRHRFWFEPNQPQAAVSEDGRLVIARVPFHVQTKDETSGTDMPADRASQSFANHLSKYFDDYAAEKHLHEFSRMQAFGVLFAIAGKLHGEPVDRTLAQRVDNPARNRHVPAWLAAEHEISPVETLRETPAINCKQPGPAGISVTLRLVGGVRLDANKPGPWNNSPAEALATELRKQMAANPQAQSWRWTMGTRTIAAVRVGQVPQRRAWHVDLEKSKLQLVRETVPADAPAAEFGAGWKLQMPRFRFSEERAVLKDAKGKKLSWPVYAQVENEAGKTFFLSVQRETTFQDGAEAVVYFSRDGQRGAILVNKEQLIYFEGGVAFFENNTVAPDGPGSKIVFFHHTTSATANPISSDANYRVEKIHGADGATVIYGYDKSQLTSISTTQGEIRFSYQDGRISRAELGDKSAVRHYRYGARGELTHVFGAGEERLGYSYGEQSRDLTAIGARHSAPTAATAGMALENQIARSEIRSPSPEMQHVHVRAINDPQKLYEFQVDGQNRDIDRISSFGKRQGASTQNLTKEFKPPLDQLLKTSTEVVVVSGDFAERHQFTEIASIIERKLLAVTSHDAEVALWKLRRDGEPLSNRRVRVIADKSWLSAKATEEGTGASIPEVVQALADQLNDPEANVVILPGHLDKVYEAAVEQLRASGAFKNKCVILLTCASPERTEDADFMQSLVRDGGAITVSRSPRKLNQRKLPAIIRQIQENLDQLVPNPRPAEVLRAINAALERLGAGELYHQARWSPQMLMRLPLIAVSQRAAQRLATPC